MDLSHWVYASDFTGREAAYLIMGVDPSTDAIESRSARHVLKRMELAYVEAFEAISFRVFVEPCLPVDDESDSAQQIAVQQPQQLRSIAMQDLLKGWWESDEVSIEAWLERGRNSFREQRFSRSEIGRWIEENQLASIYFFSSAPKQNEKNQSLGQEKPLSTKERNTLLTIIAALAKHAKIDVKEAGKSAQYISGLTEEMGAIVSKRTIEDKLKQIPDALEVRMK